MPTGTVSPQVYRRVFGALLALLVLTVAANLLDLGRWGVVLALAIAMGKAGVIVLFFMEVRYSSRLTWLFSGAAVLWLLVLLVVMMSDYTTRDWLGPRWREGTGPSNHVEFRR